MMSRRIQGVMVRPRRLRASDALRRLARDTRLSADQLVMPLFVRPGKRIRAAIPSMPGQFQWSADAAAEECRLIADLGIPAVLLFGLGDRKDERGSRAWAEDGVVQSAVSAIRRAAPQLLVITDVCLCAYTTHGHCGVLSAGEGRRAKSEGKSRRHQRSPHRSPPTLRLADDVWVDNDATVDLLSKVALSHAAAGAGMVAPSDMMDGTVGSLRGALDYAGFDRVPIMAYAAKFASVFYGPFRDAVDSAPQVGNRQTYQMDVARAKEAVREAALDAEQGADIVMVKPALAFLDVIQSVKRALRVPVAAFNVSGEYAMVKAAAARGWLPESPAWMEMLLGMKRAGADILITYWAKDAARQLKRAS
jgi:porphobilinogen synthase